MPELTWPGKGPFGAQDSRHTMSDHNAPRPGSEKPLLAAVLVILVVYGVCLAFNLPQLATAMVNGAHAVEHAADEHAVGHAAEAAEHAAHAPPPHPPYYTVVPFVLLLACIAVLPLLHATEHWWESNRNRFIVAATLGLTVLGYYGLLHEHAIARHFLGHALVEPTAQGISWQLPWTVVQNAIFNEYIPFIMLLFALYTISGGIRIQGDLPAHPVTNTGFIAVGGLLASFIGTTGAAMLLIRPLLETNSERRQVRHTVVFFIFVVCNCGGLLLPIGDPPLFLGYLQGVDFLWTLSLWPQFLIVNGLLLAVYFVWDRFLAYPKERPADVVVDEIRVRKLTFQGLWPNVPLLFGIVLSVALLDPSKPVPGTDWHPWLYLREMVQLTLIGLSVLLGSKAVREANRFNYAAIIEVAALFFGIFICMQPALQILEVAGGDLGVTTPMQFFWITGVLSSVLDNAPTYLVFFKTAQSLHAGGELMAGVPVDILAAISLGAVLMGAMTYIGNGPNFMVKTIAENSGVRMPSFFGYMLYSCGVLLPILAVVAAYSFLF